MDHLARIDAVISGVAAYAGAAMAGGLAQANAPSHPDLLIPSMLGAAFAGLRTVLPAFLQGNPEPPTATADRALMSLTGGFAAGYYGSEWIWGIVADPVRPPLAFGAVIVAAAGELVISLFIENFIKSIKAKGGGK